jgi:TonB-dependent starch-binding outer membrane protein SusC
MICQVATRAVWLVMALAGPLLAAGAAGQAAPGGEGGVITGQVSDKDLQQPVGEAVVSVVGANIRARTTADGHFRLAGVPAGPVELRAVRLGYQTATVSVVVAAGTPAHVNFTLARVAAQLNAQLVTATQETESRRETGANVAVVQADSIPQSTITDFSDMLTGRVAGVVVEKSSGETGTGSTIRIRGASSLYLTNEPIYIVDGVRLDNNSYTTNLGLGGQGPSRVDEIPEQDIETFEILKGPTASALYGTAAANGIVSITTKHGEEGPTHWDFFAEGGTVQNATHFPPNWGTLTQSFGPNVPGYPEATDCSLNYQALQVDSGPGSSSPCVPDASTYKNGIVTYNPIADHSPYRIGQIGNLGLAAHGGIGTTTFFLSGTRYDETGIFPNNSTNKSTIRANANFQLTQQLGVAVTGSYLTSNTQLPQNDNGYYGPLSNGYLGYAVGTSVDAYGHPSFGYNPIPPSQAESYFDAQGLDHYTLGATASWHPLSWFSVTAVTGLDQDWQYDQEFEPPNTVFVSPIDSIGHRYAFREVIQSMTENVAATATAHPFDGVTAKSTVGFQYYEFYQYYLNGEANNPAPFTTGSGSLATATSQPFTTENTLNLKQISVLGSEAISWLDRRYLQVSLRGDKNSTFGPNHSVALYPAANASWVLSDENFWPRNNTVSSLRAHTAYGASGLEPQTLAATTYCQPVSVKFNGNELAGCTYAQGSIGSNVKPERSDEVEGGLEWGFFKDRVTFDATSYYKYTSQVLVAVPLAPSLGGTTSQLQNLGSVQNLGIELSLYADIIKAEDFDFTVTGEFSGNQNRLLSLGPGDSTPVILPSGNQMFRRGYPLAGFWTIPLTSVPGQPANGLSGLENVGNAYNTQGGINAYAYRGSSIPVRDASLSPQFTFFKTLRVQANFEYRGGFKQFDASEQFRCTFGTCRGNNDPTDSWNDKVCAAAALETSGAYEDCWIENADFLKLREVTVEYNFPDRWARVLKASHMSVALSARNLATLWTLWKGVDPEVDSDGQDNFNRYQFAVQPLARYFTIRFNASY